MQHDLLSLFTTRTLSRGSSVPRYSFERFYSGALTGMIRIQLRLPLASTALVDTLLARKAGH